MALKRSNTLRRIATIGATGIILISPALLAGCDVIDGSGDPVPSGGTASAAQATADGSVAKGNSRSSILSALINILASRRDANRDVIRNL